MRLKKYILLAASILLISSTAAASVSCDVNYLSVKTEKGKMGFAPAFCHITTDSISATYSGNISQKIEVTVTKRDTYDYLITLVADARELPEDSYRGRVEIIDSSANLLTALPAYINVGNQKIEDRQITISKDDLRFTFKEMNQEDCYTVKISNTGTDELTDLRAEIKTYENANLSWVTINNIDQARFKQGEQKDLRICVNNRDNFTGYTNRESIIAVKTDEVKKEIKLSLNGDWEAAIQKKYDQLLEQHQFLEKAYSQTRNYKTNYETLDVECSKFLQNHSINDSTGKADKTACTQLIDKYGNVSKEYYNITLEFEKLKRNQSLLVNLTRQQNTSSNGNDSLKVMQELSAANAKIQELNDAIAEKEVTINLLNSKPRKNETQNQANDSLSLTAIGSVIKNQPNAPYIIAPAALILAAAGYLVLRRRKKNKAPVSVEPAASPGALPQEPGAATPVLAAAPSPSPANNDREAQKAALRKLLLEKLANQGGK